MYIDRIPTVSVVIATSGTALRIRNIISQLKMIANSESIEVVLVINSSTPEKVALGDVGNDIRVVLEPKVGKSNALNTAMRHCHGTWLVFTDDDVRLTSNWISRLIKDDIPSQVSIVGGRCLNDGRGPEWIEKSRNLQELLLCRHDLGEITIPYPFGKYPIGTNMAVRRSFVISTGATWPVDQGPGTALPVGDESVFLSQISPPSDRSRLYIADAVVYHPIDSRYLRLIAAAKRTYQGGYACGLLNAPTKDPDSIARAYDAIRYTGSIKEFICSATRAVGLVMGNLARKRRGG